MKTYEEALGALEEIWNVVPRSARPLRKGDYEDVRRALEKGARADPASSERLSGELRSPLLKTAVEAIEARRSSESENAPDSEDDSEGEDEDDGILAEAITLVQAMDVEEREVLHTMLDAMITLSNLPHPARAAVFEVLGLEYCTECGVELEAGVEHTCEGEGESEEGAPS